MPYTLTTKFYLPEPAPNAVARPHLLARLDRGLDRRLTIICAPAGFGKTTLGATWLRALAADGRGGPRTRVAWYALDATDNDLATFVARLVAALRRADPTALPDWIDLDRRPIVPRATHLAAELAHGAAASVDRLVIALEDYHLITNAAIHQLLTEWIRLLPPTVRVLIMTRHDPMLGLARLRAHGDILELRAHDLAFSRAEAADLLTNIVGESLDPEMVHLLWKQTEGWLVGLCLAGLSLQGVRDRARFAADFGRHGSRHIGDYLMDEVLRKQPTMVEDFLLRTSILSRLTGPLCAAVVGVGRPQGQALLDQIVAHDLFVTALDDYGGWYRYHAQFQLLLRHRLQARLGDQEVAALHRRAAEWLAAEGLLDEALPHYLAAGDVDAAARLVEAQAPRLEHLQHWGQLAQWLAVLPAEVTETRPGLLLARAWLLYARSAWSRIPPLVDRAETILGASSAPPVGQAAILWGQIHALRTSVVFPVTSIEAKIEHGRAALRLLPAEYTRARATALNFLSRWLNAVGQPDEARRLNEDELAAIAPSDILYAIRVYYNLCVLEYFAADLDRYEAVGRRLHDLSEQANQPIDLMWAKFILGRIHLQRNEIETALDHLAALFAHPSWASLQALLMGAYLLLPLYAERSLTERGVDVLTALRQRLMEAPDDLNRREIDALEAYWAMLSGDMATATAWARAAGREPALEHEWRRGFILARVLLARGDAADLAEAADLLENLRLRYKALHYTPEHVQTLALLARVRWLQGARETALAALREAIDHGYPRGYRYVFTEHGTVMGEMLHSLARETRYAEGAGVLLLSLAKTRAGPPQHQVAETGDGLLIIESLTSRELEILSALEQGLSNKEIAHRLQLAPQTVRNHTVNIYAKLCVAGRRQAVARAREIGLLTPS